MSSATDTSEFRSTTSSVRWVALIQSAVVFMAAALWQHFVAAASQSCNLTLADRIISATTLNTLWPDVFEPRASGADAAVSLLGVPYEFWSLALFVLLGAAMINAMRR